MMYAKDYRHQAWEKMRGNWGIFALITLFVLVIESLLGFTFIGTILLMGPFTLGLAHCSLKVTDGQKLEFEDVFEGFKNFASAMLLFLLNMVLVFLWSLLFIIPGIIKHYSYKMSFYILHDNPSMSANEARKKSMEMMNGHKWRLFCLHLSFIGWILLATLTYGILYLWVIPYMKVATDEFYHELKNANNKEIEQKETAVEQERETIEAHEIIEE